MTTTGIDSIDKTLHKTNEWLAGISGALETHDRKASYTALRAVLHALRDRLPLASVVGLAAQLPTLIRGIYYDGWQPEKGPAHVRSIEEFLGMVERDFPPGLELDAEDAARAVFRVMDIHLDANETVKIIHLLPRPIQELWRGPIEPRDT